MTMNITPVDSGIHGTNSLSPLGTDNSGSSLTTNPSSPNDFASSVIDSANNFVKTLEKAEATSIAGVKGDASTYEVAGAVMEAEQALRMTIAIRDKIVSAYLEISRMQI